MLEASSFPSSAYFWNVALVPEDSGRVTRTIFSSGPPTSFQFVVFPVKMEKLGYGVASKMTVTEH